MSFGVLTDAQRLAMAGFVRGRQVTDLGALGLELAHELANLGAREVVAVDKERMPVPSTPVIVTIQKTFDRYRAAIDVAFVSWPVNRFDDGLLCCLERATTIIYLGKNTDGMACGFEALYVHLSGRVLQAYVPDVQNCLVIAGGELPVPRKLTGEEKAAIYGMADIWSYERAER